MSNTKPSSTFMLAYLFLVLLFFQCTGAKNKVEIQANQHIVLLGNNLCSRMLNFGHFETELHARFPSSELFIRNMCDDGNTAGFRPHSGRNTPWAFEGAAEYHSDILANFEVMKIGGFLGGPSKGHFEYPDEWLTRLEADVILACFGASESFEGKAGLDNFKAELTAFIKHTQQQKYNGKATPKLILVSPIAFQDISDKLDVPDGEKENENLALYTQAMQAVSTAHKIPFINAFEASKKWFAKGEQLTIDGMQLNEAGYKKFSTFLADQTTGEKEKVMEATKKAIHEAVMEKNWMWHNDFKVPNGVHVFGQRYKPFGPENYPFELEKNREMTANRDQAIWAAAQGESFDLAKADANTSTLPAVKTNYKKSRKNGTKEYLYGQDATDKLKLATGYKVELFASEKEFPNLANPVQMSFDNKGRLWVAVMPSYPHYKIGDSKPNDKLLILEDTDQDGKADKETVWADGLHLPIGFEFAPEGVYISQGTNLILLSDTDGDDKADKSEIIFSGFDDHDTHHAISAFCADPSGAIYMSEGVFLRSNIETPYGAVRATNGGFFRFNPQRRHLERTAQVPIPNPWGIAFDDWGQQIFLIATNVYWMMPGSVKPRYGISHHLGPLLIRKEDRVRPTSGLEIISSSHFPDEVQGDFLLANTIGFLGLKQHTLKDEEGLAGYKSRFRQDLLRSEDTNFRPVDLEFAPDGSLYFLDWHNVLIGHMQHNARDPLRDHVHGRVYRITYPTRPLVKPAEIDGASIATLLDNLKLAEYRTRYRSRRALRARAVDQVLAATKKWVANLDKTAINYEHNRLEALWVTWGANKVDQDLLKSLLQSTNFKVRAAAVKVLRYMSHQIVDYDDLLLAAAKDEHPRVRLDAIIAASWHENTAKGIEIVEAAGQLPLDEKWLKPVYQTALAHLNDQPFISPTKKEKIKTKLKGKDRKLFVKGKEIYDREGFCETCHQKDGGGMTSSGFPPLAGTKWALGNEERLIKLTMKGLFGPIEVKGKKYPGNVPMTPYGAMLNDEEIAAVLTYVRNAFGNNASPISPEKVKEVREKIKDKEGFYSPEELLEEHPHE